MFVHTFIVTVFKTVVINGSDVVIYSSFLLLMILQRLIMTHMF